MRSLIGNKVAEKDIRDWLRHNGYNGNSAKFAEIELHAIQRPGWLQVFRFSFQLPTANDQFVQLFGAMQSDERYGPPKIMVSEELSARDAQLAEWSLDLISPHRSRS